VNDESEIEDAQVRSVDFGSMTAVRRLVKTTYLLTSKLAITSNLERFDISVQIFS